MEAFRKALRGYEPAQVDALVSELRNSLEQARAEVARLTAENARLSSEVEGLKGTESAVQQALVDARLRADEVLVDARNEAETLLKVAREAAARYQDELKGRVSDLQWQIERLTLQKQRFEREFRELLEGYLAGASGERVETLSLPNSDRAERSEHSSPSEVSEGAEPEPEREAVGVL